MFIEDYVKAKNSPVVLPPVKIKKPNLSGLYVGVHPRNQWKSIVVAPGVGCVFIGNAGQCAEYIDTNADRF